MYWAFRQILMPFKYLTIHQGNTIFRSKAVYDWILPILLAMGSAILLTLFPGGERMFYDGGIIGSFRTLLELLIPFYIVALAAVATFDRKGLDEEMKGFPAVIKTLRSTGIYAEHILTRRQFICYLFGYLSSCSLILFVILLIMELIEKRTDKIVYIILGSATIYLKGVAAFVFLIPIWQIIITTLLGIYFMSERLQVMTDIER